MADHLREQILDAIVTNLTGLVTTGANVSRLRVYPHDSAKLPSLNIKQSDEDVLEESPHDYVDRELTVNIEARAKSSAVQLDQILNQISKEVTIALAADIHQGVTGLINTTEIGTSEPELADDEETNKPTALMIMTWLFYYRTTRADPSAT